MADPRSGGVVASGTVFDRCTAEPDAFFVDPFAVGTDPLEWRALQDAVLQQLLSRQPAGGGELDAAEVTEVAIEEALLALGIRAEAAVVVWLTAPQRAAVEVLMEELEETLAFEVVAWQLGDSLLRAVRANRRGPG